MLKTGSGVPTFSTLIKGWQWVIKRWRMRKVGRRERRPTSRAWRRSKNTCFHGLGWWVDKTDTDTNTINDPVVYLLKKIKQLKKKYMTIKGKILWYHKKVRPWFHGPAFTCVFYFMRMIFLVPIELNNSIPGDTSGKESACQCRRHKKHGFNPWVWKIPWRRALQPIPVFLPRESHGQRSLVG